MRDFSLQAPATPSHAESVLSLPVGAKVALVSPPSADPHDPVPSSRTDQQHTAKRPWELLQTAWCYAEVRCSVSSFPPVG